jgi:hypothetical protein
MIESVDNNEVFLQLNTFMTVNHCQVFHQKFILYFLYFCSKLSKKLRTSVELVPTLMIDDAETKMRTEAAVLFELKTSVAFCHALQICELIYVDIYLARSRQVLR